MDIKLKITFNQKPASVFKALNDGLIQIDGNCFVSKENVRICISTLLLDKNGCEIFENDIVCDSEGKKFQIIYQNGAFFAKKIEASFGGDLIPLYLLQINGYIPATKIC